LAIWLYGGQLTPGGSPGDVDLHVVLEREPDDRGSRAIRALHESICQDLGISELDAWYVLMSEASASEGPRDINWHVEVRDVNWALKRAHWAAGAYVLVYGLSPDDVVLRPRWSEIEDELLAQVAIAGQEIEGDCPHPAVLTMKLCRVLLSLVTREVVHSKLDAARWMLSKLSPESQAHVAAAMRTYKSAAEAGDDVLIAQGMKGFYRELQLLMNEDRDR
jgi:hypothetical protein